MKSLKDFEKFVSSGSRTNPFISIRRNGQLAFSMGAVNKYKLGNFNYVTLWISKDGLTVAVQLTNDSKDEGTIPIQKRAGNFSFSAGTFLSLNDIQNIETRQFKFTWNPDDKIAFFHPKGIDRITLRVNDINQGRKTYSFKHKVNQIKS